MFQNNGSVCIDIEIRELQKKYGPYLSTVKQKADGSFENITAGNYEYNSNGFFYVAGSVKNKTNNELGIPAEAQGKTTWLGYPINYYNTYKIFEDLKDYQEQLSAKWSDKIIEVEVGEFMTGDKTQNSTTRTYLIGESLNLNEFQVIRKSCLPEDFYLIDSTLDNNSSHIQENLIENFTITPQVFTKEGRQNVIFSYYENNVEYTKTIEVEVLPYKIFSLSNWDEIYQTCCGRQYGDLEEKQAGDVWQRFVKIGDTKLLSLTGNIDDTSNQIRTATIKDNEINEEKSRVFPLYEKGYCTVSVIGIETDGYDDSIDDLKEKNIYPKAKGTITFQVSDLKNTLESFAQSTNLVNKINAWRSTSNWVSQMLFIKYCYFFYLLLDDKMKQYINNPNMGYQIHKYNSAGTANPRNDLKTGYYANIDVVQQANYLYETFMGEWAWIQENENSKTRAIYYYNGKDMIEITDYNEWEKRKNFNLLSNIPYPFEWNSTDGYKFALNTVQDSYYIVQGKFNNFYYFVTSDDSDEYYPENRKIVNSINYKRVIKLPSYITVDSDMIIQKPNTEGIYQFTPEGKNRYIKKALTHTAQIYNDNLTDVIASYELITNGNNIKAIKFNEMSKKRFHQSDMNNMDTIYPYMILTKNMIMEQKEKSIKDYYWPITPIFIPSAYEYGYTNIFNNETMRQDELTKLEKFISNEDGSKIKTYCPKFRIPKMLYPEGENEDNRSFWLRDVILDPRTNTQNNVNHDKRKYIQLKMYTDTDEIFTNNLASTANSGEQSDSDEGLNTTAYIAPAFTIRPKRNHHPKDEIIILEPNLE